MRCAVRFLALLLFYVFCEVRAIDVMSILESVHSDERAEFVRYYAKRGYELSGSPARTINKECIMYSPTNQNLKIEPEMSDEFAVALYDFLVERDIICFEDGTCIEICDPGIHPT